MKLPVIRDPETGDPIGFVIDAEGRYVDRGEFEFKIGLGMDPHAKGLKHGDRVYMHGQLVYTEPDPLGSRFFGPATQEAHRRIEEYGDYRKYNKYDAAGLNSNHGPGVVWSRPEDNAPPFFWRWAKEDPGLGPFD